MVLVGGSHLHHLHKPLEGLAAGKDTYGDMVRMEIFGLKIVLLFNANHIEEV